MGSEMCIRDRGMFEARRAEWVGCLAVISICWDPSLQAVCQSRRRGPQRFCGKWFRWFFPGSSEPPTPAIMTRFAPSRSGVRAGRWGPASLAGPVVGSVCQAVCGQGLRCCHPDYDDFAMNQPTDAELQARAEQLDRELSALLAARGAAAEALASRQLPDPSADPQWIESHLPDPSALAESPTLSFSRWGLRCTRSGPATCDASPMTLCSTVYPAVAMRMCSPLNARARRAWWRRLPPVYKIRAIS